VDHAKQNIEGDGDLTWDIERESGKIGRVRT
jgi:hypothetical protein